MHAGLTAVGVGEVTAKASAALINGALGPKTRPVLYLAHARLSEHTTLNASLLLKMLILFKCVHAGQCQLLAHGYLHREHSKG